MCLSDGFPEDTLLDVLDPGPWKGLSFYTTEKKLAELFSPFGVLTEARLVMDSSTQRHRGFGFVTYESEKDALKAVKALNNRIIDGRLIFVEFAKPKVASDNSS